MYIYSLRTRSKIGMGCYMCRYLCTVLCEPDISNSWGCGGECGQKKKPKVLFVEPSCVRFCGVCSRDQWCVEWSGETFGEESGETAERDIRKCPKCFMVAAENLDHDPALQFSINLGYLATVKCSARSV